MRARPRLRRVRITRRPVWERIRTRKPETRFLLRFVPPRVRLVMDVSWLPADLNLGFYQSVHIDQPAAAVAGHRHITGGLHQGIELIHALPLGVEQLDVERVIPV